MQIAAADPRYLRSSATRSRPILEKEKEIARDRAHAKAKPDKILDKIVAALPSSLKRSACLTSPSSRTTRRPSTS